jgi:hypothetical protein
VVGGQMDQISVAKKHFEHKLEDGRKLGRANFKWLKVARE